MLISNDNKIKTFEAELPLRNTFRLNSILNKSAKLTIMTQSDPIGCGQTAELFSWQPDVQSIKVFCSGLWDENFA